MKAIGNEIGQSSVFICHECSRVVSGDADRRHFCTSSDFLLGVIAGMSGESKTDAYMVLGLSSFNLDRVNDQDFCDGYVVGSDIADARWSHAEIEAQRRLLKMVARMTALNVEQFAETPVGQALRQVAFAQGRNDGIEEGVQRERTRLEHWWEQKKSGGYSKSGYERIRAKEYARLMRMPLDEFIGLRNKWRARHADSAEVAQ